MNGWGPLRPNPSGEGSDQKEFFPSLSPIVCARGGGACSTRERVRRARRDELH